MNEVRRYFLYIMAAASQRPYSGMTNRLRRRVPKYKFAYEESSMPKEITPNEYSGISTMAARVAIVAIISYQILLVLLIFLRPDLDPSWHSISEWAIGPYGWLMTLAFWLSSVSYAALLVMLRKQIHGMLGRVGLGMLTICAIGAFAVGVFTTDPMPFRSPMSTVGILHVVFGTTQLVLLPFSALLINLSLARKSQFWMTKRRVILSTAAVPLIGFLGFVLYTAIFVFPKGQNAYGPGVNIGWPPRFAFFTYMLWVVTLAWQGIKCSQLQPSMGQVKSQPLPLEMSIPLTPPSPMRR